ncbi:MAG TPA: lysophospholipid acyltransferase family protein [Anaerolineales bacterium]|nr:lysophospholipid acyltransferase family protein [Anaerolineales bacterium]
MAYPQSTQLKARRFILKFTFRQIFRATFQTRIRGWEKIPSEGAYIIAHNHVSIIEPALILSFWPVNAEAIGAAELWTRRGQAGVIKMYGTLPVHRGSAERELIRTMVSVLEAGTPLLIAPEGTRSHTPGMGPAQAGIGYMIDQARVPVLPIGVIGSTDDNLRAAARFKRPLLEMNIGDPFTLPVIEGSGHVRREARKENTENVMMRLCSLLPENYWGVYADKYRSTLETAR